jgi:hypothetical protein
LRRVIPNNELQPFLCLKHHLVTNLILWPKNPMGTDCDSEEILSIVCLEHLLFLKNLGLSIDIDGLFCIRSVLVSIFQILALINHAAAAGEDQTL